MFLWLIRELLNIYALFTRIFGRKDNLAACKSPGGFARVRGGPSMVLTKRKHIVKTTIQRNARILALVIGLLTASPAHADPVGVIAQVFECDGSLAYFISNFYRDGGGLGKDKEKYVSCTNPGSGKCGYAVNDWRKIPPILTGDVVINLYTDTLDTAKKVTRVRFVLEDNNTLFTVDKLLGDFTIINHSGLWLECRIPAAKLLDGVDNPTLRKLAIIVEGQCKVGLGTTSVKDIDGDNWQTVGVDVSHRSCRIIPQ